MRIRINDIPLEGLTLSVDLDPAFMADALEGVGADLERSQAHADLLVTFADPNVFARGRLQGKVALTCSRCLNATEVPLSVPLKMTFAPEGQETEEGGIEEDIEFGTHDGREVELDSLLREAVILTLPMTPLCRADCKGLCPVCGQDQNISGCNCEMPLDPRVSALQGLKF